MHTIENAYIIPILFFVIIGLFEIELYFLDVAKVMSTVSVSSAFASMSIDKSDDEVFGSFDIVARNKKPLYKRTYVEDEMRLSDRIDGELSGRLLLLSMKKSEVKISGSKVNVEYEFEANHPIFKYFHISPIRYKSCNKVEVGNYAEVMRKKKVFNDIKEKIKNEE